MSDQMVKFAIVYRALFDTHFAMSRLLFFCSFWSMIGENGWVVFLFFNEIKVVQRNHGLIVNNT